MTFVQKFKFVLFYICMAFFLPLSWAGSSVLIWPIDPVIEDYQQASALWLENKGTESAYFQIRTLKWIQKDGEEIYQPQQEIIASPPFARIEPGKKQLIRLVRDASGKVPAGEEKAYRVFIDEIPQKPKQPNEAEKKAAAGLQLQMRYSIPLFSSGKGVWTKEDSQNHRNIKTISRPELKYTLENKKGQWWITFYNRAAVHARISALTLSTPAKDIALYDGLVGYVLPGTTMSYAIPKKYQVNAQSVFKAKINNDLQVVNLSPQDGNIASSR